MSHKQNTPFQSKITPPQLAERWGVSKEKIVSLIHAGLLRAVDISEGERRSRFLIDEADIAAFERARQTKATEV